MYYIHYLKRLVSLVRPYNLNVRFKLSRQFHGASNCNGVANLPYGHYNFPTGQEEFATSSDEWHFVEQLIPQKFIPLPAVAPGHVMPSGWIAPRASKDDCKYFVRRNANHLLRVYFNFHPILIRPLTYVKGIEGDIFGLAEELKVYLKTVSAKRLVTIRVKEPHSLLIIKGDYVYAVKRFLVEKGF